MKMERKYDYSNLILKKTKNGRGVFASKQLKKGDVILKFYGNFFTYDELPTPYDAVRDHYVQIEKNRYIGPSGGIDDFINHSCDPNAGVKITREKGGAFLVAIKNISKNSQITWDYSTTMNEDDWEMDCNCRKRTCRKRIRDFKYIPKRTQQKYIRLGIVPNYAFL